MGGGGGTNNETFLTTFFCFAKKNTIFRHQIVFLHGEYYYASGTICAMGQRNVRD